MNHNIGALALVGSGEYTEPLLDLERELIDIAKRKGKNGPYVQFATAAGEEHADRIEYWKNLGAVQAKRLGIESVFIPVLNREDALDPKWISQIKGASLIYFSGGDPLHLATSLINTDLLAAIIGEHKSGTSLGGCSAGAMAMCSHVGMPWRSNSKKCEGFHLISNYQVLPHFDRFFSAIPSAFLRQFPRFTHENVIGIDEKTALLWNGDSWIVRGHGGVHFFNQNRERNSFHQNDVLDFLPIPYQNNGSEI